MQGYKGPGETLTLDAPYDVASGAGFLVGSLFAVAAKAAANGDPVEGVRCGEFTSIAKTSTDVWAVGDQLYWDDTNKRLDLDSTVGPFVAVATAVTANPSSTGQCVLVDATVLLEGSQTTVAAVATADSDATYGAPESTLINEIKAQFNSLLAELKSIGIIKSS